MIRRLCILILSLALPGLAAAEAVRVTSGEHEGFTRLVLEFGAPVEWQVGRTSDGYELQLSGAKPPYDFTGVYDIIGRTRLASVWADPQTGALRIGIGCACHAQPFEFRPGIVVIDLKDGPPPSESVFERALDGGEVTVAQSTRAPREEPRPRTRPVAAAKGYDWTATARGQPQAAPSEATRSEDIPLPGADPSLEPLRAALVHQLSRGAAQGLIEMAKPEAPGTGPTGTDSVEIHLSEVPGMLVGGEPKGVTAKGEACVPADDIDIASWGSDAPVADQLAGANRGLIGEFDAPDATGVARAVKLYLFLGFGAEARGLLAAMPSAQPEAALWSSMARILDAERDPVPAFAGMAACDSAAALWAMLGDPVPAVGEAVNRAAVLRTFSALPLRLRRALGPALADRFLTLNDPGAADFVRDAILRAPGDPGPEVAVMEARIHMGAGEPEAAAAKLEPLIESSGPATPDALVELVDSRVAARAPMEPAQIVALEGLLHDRRGTPEEGRFARALTLAEAVSGQFDAAFDTLEAAPEAEPDVWALLADLGADSAVLEHAVLPATATPRATPAAAARLAQRLLDLGFADAASAWLGQIAAPDPLLAAHVALQQKDARRTLGLIAGSVDPAAEPLRADALRLLGDEPALAETLTRMGDDAARWRAVARASDWATLATAGPDPWRALAGLAGPPAAKPVTVEDAGALQKGAEILEASAATRTAIEDLLATIEPPTRAQP